MGLLSALILLPIAGAVALALIPETFTKLIKGLSVAFSGLVFGVSLLIFGQFTGDTFHFQMVERADWVPSLGIQYLIGVDGLSVWLILLTTLLTFLCCIFSTYVTKRVRLYFALMLALEAAMLGVFMALDMVLFYAFFEFTLIPMALMIGIWGGKERMKAGVKFFVYTFAASIFLLIGIIWLANLHAQVTGEMTFSIVAIQRAVASGQLWAGFAHLQPILFWMFSLALLVKCPMFPFHTWLPDAHTEAPTAGSIILAGVLLKMGTYAFLRIVLPLFPEATQQFVVPIMVLAVIGILYGAAVAAMQPDVKRLVAYSSVAHMGFVMLGIFSLSHTGMMGGAYQQLNHGISTGALFLLIGLLYERIHTRRFKDMGGIKQVMPWFAALFLIVMLSSVGLPGTNGFVGEFGALMGAFETGAAGAFGLPLWLPIAAGAGVILAAIYLLWMFQKTFYGPVTNVAVSRLKDIRPWEVALVGVFVLFIFWGGLYPITFTAPMEKSVGAVRQMVVNEPGERPMWSDPTMEIASNGDLVRMDRDEEIIFETIADGGLHFPVEPPLTVHAKEDHHDEEDAH